VDRGTQATLAKKTYNTWSSVKVVYNGFIPSNASRFCSIPVNGFYPTARTEMYDLWVSPIMIRDNIRRT
jgi:hypothetical protein